jgi:RHS repeat-associated protein
MGLLSETGGASQARYTYNPATRKVLSISSGGSARNYARDSLGSTTGLVSSTGNLQDTYSYDPYGQDNGRIGATYNPFRYTGIYQDDSTGLYRMRDREYAPGTGRFTQLDPLASTIYDGQRYAYTGGNPANFVDPTGNGRVTLNCGSAWVWARPLVDGKVFVDYGLRSIRGFMEHISYALVWYKWWPWPPNSGGFRNSVAPWDTFWSRSSIMRTGRGNVLVEFNGYVITSQNYLCGFVVFSGVEVR